MPVIKKNFIRFIYKEKSGAFTKLKQEVDDDLSVCAMNILPKVSSLPSLLAISLMKM